MYLNIYIHIYLSILTYTELEWKVESSHLEDKLKIVNVRFIT